MDHWRTACIQLSCMAIDTATCFVAISEFMSRQMSGELSQLSVCMLGNLHSSMDKSCRIFKRFRVGVHCSLMVNKSCSARIHGESIQLSSSRGHFELILVTNGTVEFFFFRKGRQEDAALGEEEVPAWQVLRWCRLQDGDRDPRWDGPLPEVAGREQGEDRKCFKPCGS